MSLYAYLDKEAAAFSNDDDDKKRSGLRAWLNRNFRWIDDIPQVFSNMAEHVRPE